MHDLVIKGGTVVDGTGAPARTADVAITDGVVTEVGAVDGQGARDGRRRRRARHARLRRRAHALRLFPVFGKTLLALGPIEVGYLWSWLGVGLFLVSLSLVWLTEWDLRRRILAVTMTSLLGGVSLLGLVWAQDIYVAAVLVTCIGIGFGTWTPIAWGIIQELSPAHMVGRVMALYTSIATATSMVGMTFFGWLLETFNASISLIGIGLVLLVLAASTAWFSPHIVRGVVVPPG